MWVQSETKCLNVAPVTFEGQHLARPSCCGKRFFRQPVDHHELNTGKGLWKIQLFAKDGEFSSIKRLLLLSSGMLHSVSMKE